MICDRSWSRNLETRAATANQGTSCLTYCSCRLCITRRIHRLADGSPISTGWPITVRIGLHSRIGGRRQIGADRQQVGREELMEGAPVVILLVAMVFPIVLLLLALLFDVVATLWILYRFWRHA